MVAAGGIFPGLLVVAAGGNFRGCWWWLLAVISGGCWRWLLAVISGGCWRYLSGAAGGGCWRYLSGAAGGVGCCCCCGGGGLGAGRHPPGWQTSPRLADIPPAGRHVKNFHNVVFRPPSAHRPDVARHRPDVARHRPDVALMEEDTAHMEAATAHGRHPLPRCPKTLILVIFLSKYFRMSVTFCTFAHIVQYMFNLNFCYYVKRFKLLGHGDG